MNTLTTNTFFESFITKKYIPLDKGKKILIFFSALLIPSLTVFFFVIQPNSQKISALEKKIITSMEELNRVRKAARDLPKHEEELRKAQEIFDLTTILLPKSQEIPDLLRNISDIGKQSGLDFLSFTPGVETPKDFYAEIPIDIKIRGPYHNLGLFLDKISKLDRIVSVNNIKTEKVDFEGNEILITSSCRLVTYRFTNVKLDPEKKDGKQKSVKKK